VPDRPTTVRAARLACALALVALAACGGEGGDEPTSDQASAAPTTEVDAPEGAAPEGSAEPADEPAGPAGEGDDAAWPVPDWTVVDPEDAGLDRAALDQMAAAAEAGGSECLVVTKDGALVGEWYWGGAGPTTEREVFSVTKSITSTLVGIAQDRGLLDIDDPAASYIEEWQGTPSAEVTIRNLVSNDSGRFHDFESDYLRMATQEADKTAFSIGLSQQHEPGTTWVYNNAAIQTLDRVLEVATGMPTGDFAEEALFEPLGMGTTMNRDPSGNTLTFMGAQASCRDLARFGLLFLRGGEWDGEQVVSQEWVEEATSPSQPLNQGYGFLWWLNATGMDDVATGGAAGSDEAGPAAKGTFAATGLNNQLIGVYPGDGVVATRLGAGAGPGGSGFGHGELSAGVAQATGGGQPPVEDAVG
jgi:CubicO group peptidase (beta-lactamase class C family)